MTTESNIDYALLEKLFPFSFSFSASTRRLTQLGPGWTRLMPGAQPGDDITELLTIEGPLCDWDEKSLREALSTNVLVLNVIGSETMLRGQLLELRGFGGSEFFFAGSIWLGAEQCLSDLGLCMTDLALHDAATDLQVLVKTQALALNDTRQVAQLLEERQLELEESNRRLKTQIGATNRAESFAQSILDTAPVGVFAATLNGRLVRCNEEFVRLIGLGSSPEPGTRLSEILGNSILSSFNEFALARCEVGCSRGLVEVVVDTTKDVQRSLQLVLGMEGRPGQEIFIGVLLDTTELKTAQSRVQEADRHLRVVSRKLQRFFDVSLEMLCRIGLDGKIQELNPSWKRTLGHCRQTLCSVPFLEFVHPEDRPATKDLLESLAQGQPCLNFENRLRCEDGSYRSLLWSAAFDSDNESIIVAARDITERVNTLRDLTVAKRAAEAANEAKTHFLANMSHELRTPLNSIIGFSKLVSRSSGLTSLGKERQFLSRVTDNGKHLLSLINDILDLSKVEAGHAPMDLASTALEPLIRDVLDSMRETGERKGLELSIAADPHCSPAIVDALRFKQVVLNLVSNAIKFTTSGRVEISLCPNPRNSLEQWVRVVDTGIGVAPGNLDTIFEPFRQVESSTARAYGGTGLGLSISRTLCSQMGVGLSVESTEGIGTTFLLKVPSTCAGHCVLQFASRNQHEDNRHSRRQPGQPIARIGAVGGAIFNESV